jgi:hypothetical protein
MISAAEAYFIASNFAKKKEWGHPGVYYFDVKPAEEFTDYYYFDFAIIVVDAELFKGTRLAGAPSILIDKITGRARVITFGQLAKLRRTEKEGIHDLYQLLIKLTENDPYLDILQTAYNLDSKGLLVLKKLIRNKEISKRIARDLASRILDG